jgi:hypothetical protein
MSAYIYGTITLYGTTFQKISILHSFPYGRLTTPHLPEGIQFELYRVRSPLLTTSLLISFPPPTEMFQFGGLPILKDQLPKELGCPIRESPDLRFHASPRSLSQLGTPFIGSRTEPSNGRFITVR